MTWSVTSRTLWIKQPLGFLPPVWALSDLPLILSLSMQMLPLNHCHFEFQDRWVWLQACCCWTSTVIRVERPHMNTEVHCEVLLEGIWLLFPQRVEEHYLRPSATLAFLLIFSFLLLWQCHFVQTLYYFVFEFHFSFATPNKSNSICCKVLCSPVLWSTI